MNTASLWLHDPDFPGGQSPLAFLILSVLSQTSMSFVQQGIAVLGLYFAHRFHLSFAGLGLLVSMPALGMMISFSAAGWLVDRLGPRRLLMIITGPMALLVASAGLIRGLVPLAGIFFLMGLTFAVVPAVGTKAVFYAFSHRNRGLPMGIRQTGVPLGASLAALVLPPLVGLWGIRPLFVVMSLALLIANGAFAWAIPPIPPQLTASAGLPIRHLLQAIWLPAGIALLLVGAQYDVLAFSLPDLVRLHRVPVGEAGLVLAVGQVGGGIGRILFGALTDRGLPVRTVLSGATLIALIAVFGVIVLPSRPPLEVLLPLWLILGIGAVGWNALALTWAGETVPAAHSGLAMSTTASIIFVGAVIHPPLFGWLADTTHHLTAGWVWLGTILVAAFGLTRIHPKSRQSSVRP